MRLVNDGETDWQTWMQDICSHQEIHHPGHKQIMGLMLFTLNIPGIDYLSKFMKKQRIVSNKE